MRVDPGKTGRHAPTSGQPASLDEPARATHPRQATALGVALTTLNPKNALLLVSGCSTILAAAPGPAAQWTALAVFIAVASLGVAAPALL